MTCAWQFRRLARKAARESIVLLKNDNGVLPLGNVDKIAVIGPNADKVQLGGYSAKGVKGISPLAGIRKVFGDKVQISYARGCDFTGTGKEGFSEAVRKASEADVCVLAMGGENWTTGGETRDRNSLDLMGVQEDLILEISKTGKPVIVVLIGGRPVTMTRWMDRADGIIMMFYTEEEGGTALAEILKGDVNPSGKLAISYPRNTGDLPMCLYHRPYGREGNIVEYGQKAMPGSRYFPLYPFGYGLSYTGYEYSGLTIEDTSVSPREDVRFSVKVTNTGNMDGDETVQVYLTDRYCRISQSEKKLKAFRKVHIPAGETRTVSFVLPYSALSFLNERLEPEVEPGDFELFVGTNCNSGVSAMFSATDAR